MRFRGVFPHVMGTCFFLKKGRVSSHPLNVKGFACASKEDLSFSTNPPSHSWDVSVQDFKTIAAATCNSISWRSLVTELKGTFISQREMVRWFLGGGHEFLGGGHEHSVVFERDLDLKDV